MNTRRTIAALLTVLCAVACLLFSACGDDDETPASPSPAPNASLDAGAEQQFRDLAGKWSTASAKITYTLTNSGGEAQVVVYRMGSDRRVDHTLGGRTTSVIVRTDLGYSCADTSNSCALLTVREASAVAEFIPFVAQLADTAGVNAIVAGAESMEVVQDGAIAGRDTICIKATGNLGGIQGPTTFCFAADDGLPLSIKYEGTPAFDMTATSVEASQEADFDPLYEVVTVPPTATP